MFFESNRGHKDIDFNWKDKYISDDSYNRVLDAGKISYKIRDLWAKRDLGTTNTPLKTNLPPHDILMMLLKP